VVEDRPIMSVKYCLPVPVFHSWPKLWRALRRGLSAIAGHLVAIIFHIYVAWTFCSLLMSWTFRT